jgi:hypothetical protein
VNHFWSFIPLSLMFFVAGPLQAMDFRTGSWKGHPALFGEGEIVQGDGSIIEVIRNDTRL